MSEPTRVLVIDDSATARLALRAALSGQPGLTVAGEAASGAEARRKIEALRPDIIALDLYLRAENGLDLSRSIMQERPTPIVLVTSAFSGDADLLFRALAAGALEVLPKPPPPRHPDYERERLRLGRALMSLAKVPVIRQRRPVARSAPASTLAKEAGRVVLIGASTGGPPTLATLLGACPPPLRSPWVVVQHIALGFTAGFARWLAAETHHPIEIADRPTVLAPGQVYLAPDGKHLVFTGPSTVAPSDAPPRSFQKPSIDLLFESAAEHVGAQALAAVLTGMGADGAEGLLTLRKRGAFTAAQRPSQCVVDSMPRRALERGGASIDLDLDELALRLA